MASRMLGLCLLVLSFPLLQSVFADEPPQQPVLPAAKTVKLSGKMKVSEALAVLAKQTGIVVADRRGEPDAELDFGGNKATFWQVFDQIATVADAQVDLYGRDGKLALKKRGDSGPDRRLQFVSYDGLFRTSLKRITAALDPENGQRTYTAALEVAWEPTLQPFYLETRPQNLMVVDDRMKQLPAVDYGKADAPVDGRNAMLFETPLPALPREAKKIALLEGKLSIIAPSSMLSFTFEPLDKLNTMLNGPKPTVPKQTLQGVECEISSIALKGDHWTVQVKLAYPPGNTKLDSNQSWIVNNELVLEALDGKRRFPATRYERGNTTSSRATLTYHFLDDPKADQRRVKPGDWKLTYRTPAAVVTIPLAFSFKDVPLP